MQTSPASPASAKLAAPFAPAPQLSEFSTVSMVGRGTTRSNANHGSGAIVGDFPLPPRVDTPKRPREANAGGGKQELAPHDKLWFHDKYVRKQACAKRRAAELPSVFRLPFHGRATMSLDWASRAEKFGRIPLAAYSSSAATGQQVIMLYSLPLLTGLLITEIATQARSHSRTANDITRPRTIPPRPLLDKRLVAICAFASPGNIFLSRGTPSRFPRLAEAMINEWQLRHNPRSFSWIHTLPRLPSSLGTTCLER
jgi:hypothetical protein